jgi:hypothetical protein
MPDSIEFGLIFIGRANLEIRAKPAVTTADIRNTDEGNLSFSGWIFLLFAPTR